MHGLNIAIRTNGGATIGFGHIRRCLTLATALTCLGRTVHFILNNDCVVRDLVSGQGFGAVSVESDRDLEQTQDALTRWGAIALVADSYDFGTDYLASLREQIELLVTIDDLADRHLPVDIIVNSDVNAPDLTYNALPHTKFLLGPNYVLLREEFAQKSIREIKQQVKQVLITVGGSDWCDLTSQLMQWAWDVLRNVILDVVVGPFFENIEAIERVASQNPGRVRIHQSPENMRILMLETDIAVTGGGQTTYELAATGTPAIAVCLAENQRRSLTGLARAGTLIFAGDVADRDLASKLADALKMLACDPKRRSDMSVNGRKIVDGKGAQRVAQAVIREYECG